MRPIAAPAVLATDLYRSTYAPIVATWSAGIEPILAEYARTLAQLTTDAPADASAQIGAVEAAAGTIVTTIRLRIEAWARRMEAFHRRRWQANVLAATGVDLETLIGPSDARMTLEAAVERNVALVRSVSDQARQRIADSVFRGFQRKAPAREIAAELRDAVAMSRRRSLLIASDQNTKLASALNDERRRDAGISAWAWVSSGKVNYRPEHKARDGFLYSEDSGQVGTEYEGRPVRAPPADMPGQLPWCGCTSRAVLIL